MSRIGVVVEFDVKSDHREEFEKLIRFHAKRTFETEEGCLQFEVLIPKQGAEKVFLFECYRDAEAFDAHAASPLLAEIRERYKDMIDNRRVTLCDAGVAQG